ncbi:MAG: hypothetical protein FOGNACKC_05635 [Anaerolineae bacterium]|nr:hypothetical protein [Anaerolineae bacterium]
MSKSWMSELAAHYESMKQRYPNDNLLILFDIDGTILDMRYLVQFVLHRYDQLHGTRYFAQLQPEAITVHENQIAPLLAELDVPEAEREKIRHWFEVEAWSPTAILEAHRPFAGVLEVIRWFQMQPLTEVGLNTGRLEAIRGETLRSLNQLGQEYKVRFANELLYMNPNTWGVPVTEAKISGIRYFQELGYRIVAFIDNEPGNLEAVANIDPNHDILLLHANTIFQSKRVQLPARAIPGTNYQLTELIAEHALPRHIHFVWRNLNNAGNLAQFLASDVYWGEFNLSVAADAAPRRGLIDSDSNWLSNWLLLERVLWRLRNRQKGIKLNLLNADSRLLEPVLELLHRYRFGGLNLWLNASTDHFKKRDFRQLVIEFPGAVVQTPIDSLAPLIVGNPTEARRYLQTIQTWGVNRFGLSWHTPDLRRLFDKLATWGFEVDVYDVVELEPFLRAVLLNPTSITTTFNFPEWSYYGVDTDQHADEELVLVS